MKQRSNVILGAAIALLALALFAHRLTVLRAEALSRAVVEVVESYAALSEDAAMADFRDSVLETYPMAVSELPLEGAAVPFSQVVERGFAGRLTLSLRRQLKQPVWVDATGNSRHVEIRLFCKRAVLRVLARPPGAWQPVNEARSRSSCQNCDASEARA